jgi:hypothetical protein
MRYTGNGTEEGGGHAANVMRGAHNASLRVCYTCFIREMNKHTFYRARVLVSIQSFGFDANMVV